MKSLFVIVAILFSASASAVDAATCEPEAREFVSHFHERVVAKSTGYTADWSQVEIEIDKESFHFFISTGNARGDYRDYEYVVNMMAGVSYCQLIDFQYLGITDWGYGGGDTRP